MRSGNPTVADVNSFYTPYKQGGFCLHKVVEFLGAVKILWLRRLPYTKSLWRHLHKEKVGESIFPPINYNMDKHKLAQQKLRIRSGLKYTSQFRSVGSTC